MDSAEDEEYLAELERAYRGVSWGCLLFVVGLLLAAIVCWCSGPSSETSTRSRSERSGVEAS